MKWERLRVTLPTIEYDKLLKYVNFYGLVRIDDNEEVSENRILYLR